jgi:hypothetical protein
MTPRVPDTHAEAWALLPWLANGRLGPEEREWVEAHLQSCAECRSELASQRMVASQVLRDESAPASPSSDEQRSFNKLWARIEASESASLPATGTSGGAVRVSRSSRTVRWLAAAVVVQAIGLGIFGMGAFGDKGGKPVTGDVFTTVARVEPRSDAPSVSLAFQPAASIGTINTLLAHQGLTIVGGPGVSGNFTAELSADAVASGATAESVAAVMSKDPNVSFAQPVAR